MSQLSIPLQGGYSYNAQREDRRHSHKLKMNALPSSSSSLKTSFDSPLRTLRESVKDFSGLHISTHDIIEAYSVLSTRIRHIIQDVSCITSSSELYFQPFSEYSSDIVLCVSRDIQRLLPTPFDSHPLEDYSSGQMYDMDCEEDWEDIQFVVENKSLCQYALRFASDLCAFPVLYSQFSDESLTSLFRDILSLCSITNCSVPNLTKARIIILWILKTQRLPTHILESVAADILATITYALNAPLETSDIKLEAFTIIHKVTKEYPRLVDPLIGLLDPMLNYLNAEALDLRICASLALCGFAIAKLKSEDGSAYPRSSATAICCEFINQDAKRAKLWGPTNRLPNILKTALTNDDAFWDALGPSFALAVVSALIVLIDRFIWETPRALKMVVNTIACFAGHRRSSVRRLHPELWRMMVWAFARLPTGTLPSDVYVVEKKSPDGLTVMREKVFRFLLQERKHGLLVDVVCPLLCPSNGEPRAEADVGRALGVMRDLLEADEAASVDDGVRLVGRMLADIRHPPPAGDSSYAPRRMFSWALVDGTLARCKTKDMRIQPFRVEMDAIPPLCEREVTVHWDELCRCWIKAVRICIERRQDLSAELLSAWQTLLLVKGEVLPGQGDLFAAPPSFAPVVRDVFNDLAPSPIGAPCYLVCVLKLWGVLKNVFTREWLAAPARMVFDALLISHAPVNATADEGGVSGDEDEGGVGKAYAAVYRELVGASIDGLLRDLEAGTGDGTGDSTSHTRKTWLAIAQSDYFSSEDARLQEVLRFLAVPIRAWDLSKTEHEAWLAALDAALELGSTGGGLSAHLVIAQFVESLGDAKRDSLKDDLRILCALMSRSVPTTSYSMLDASYHSPLDSKLLALVTGTLREFYGSRTQVGDDEEKHGLEVLSLLRSFAILLSTVPAAEIVRFLAATQESLIPWISDERRVLRDDVHAEVVSVLYKRPLEILAGTEPSIATLTTLADFLHAVFLRIRGDGVLAFSAFWRATYHARPDIPKGAYPAPIKACLRAWSVFCDDSLADDVIDSQSQELSLADSPIPDSQLAPSVCFDDEAYIEEYEMMFAEEAAAAARGLTPAPAPATPGDRDLPQSGASAFASSSSIKEDADSRIQNVWTGDAGNTSNLEDPAGCTPNVGCRSSPVNVKRQSEEPESPSTKRRRVDSEVRRISFIPRRSGKSKGKGKARLEEWSMVHESDRGAPLTTVSVPASVVLSPTMDYQPSAVKHSVSFGGSVGAGNVQSPGGRDRWRQDDGMNEAMIYSSEDDYDSWERGITVDNLRMVHDVLREGVNSDDIVPDSEGERGFEREQASDVESVSLSQSAPRGRGRSQTTPINRNEPGHHPPLRQQHTSPGPSGKRPATPLDALKDAYTAFADASGRAEHDANSDDDDVEEILQARRLVHQISAALDERIGQKIKGKRKGK